MEEKQLINDALKLFRSGISAVHPATLFKTKISLKENGLIISDINNISERINLDDFERIIIIGAGKASAAMARELEELLLPVKLKITGLVVTKYGCTQPLKNIKVVEAGHPLPDQDGVKATEELLTLVATATENDIIINLLSGGASALLPAPVEGITLQDKIKTTRLLLEKSVTINEINTIRKHLSKIKGGKLLQYTYPARVISLIISDVMGDRLDTIGSGLTFPDKSTVTDVFDIIAKYNLTSQLPVSVFEYLTKEAKNKQEDLPLSQYSNYIIANNHNALTGIVNAASDSGYIPQIVNGNLEGEASEIGKQIVKDVLELKRGFLDKNKKHCFIYGGETTVTIRGNGKGGRNQELVLSAAIELDGRKDIFLLGGGTDGNDGPTDAAGAFCTGETVKIGAGKGLDAKKFLENNDSYHYFNAINHLVKTGFSGTNVADVVIVLTENNEGD